LLETFQAICTHLQKVAGTLCRVWVTLVENVTVDESAAA
jgi:hypothetical protein